MYYCFASSALRAVRLAILQHLLRRFSTPQLKAGVQYTCSRTSKQPLSQEQGGVLALIGCLLLLVIIGMHVSAESGLQSKFMPAK